VIVDGRLVFSKTQTGRFPIDDEVESIVKALKNGEEPPPPAVERKPSGFVERLLSKLKN
jgi:hypothetical protein